MTLLATPFIFILEVRANEIRQEEEIKNVEERNSLSLSSDDMTINAESLKELTEKLLELRRNYRKVEGYKVNTIKSITFLYNSSKQWDFNFKIKCHLPTPPRK